MICVKSSSLRVQPKCGKRDSGLRKCLYLNLATFNISLGRFLYDGWLGRVWLYKVCMTLLHYTFLNILIIWSIKAVLCLWWRGKQQPCLAAFIQTQLILSRRLLQICRQISVYPWLYGLTIPTTFHCLFMPPQISTVEIILLYFCLGIIWLSTPAMSTGFKYE